MMNPATTAAGRQDESILGKLSASTRRTMEALIHSPLGKQALQEIETQTVGRRRGLIASLAALEKSYPLERSKTEPVCVKAMRALEAAEMSRIALREEYRIASSIHNGVETSYLMSRSKLERELKQGADGRLFSFRFELGNLVSRDLPIALKFWPDLALKRATWHSQRSNTVECAAARVALQDAISKVDTMMLQALTYDEVSVQLRALCAALAHVLAAIELNPPCLTTERAEVSRPITWHGYSEWQSTEVRDFTLEERAAKSEADASKLAHNQGRP